MCRTAGWKGATVKNCTPGRAYVERFREHGVIAVQRKHAKLFFDKFTPRIHRNRQGYKPGDIVVGDVHPFDVQREIDGRIVHARLISWLDVATYDLFVTVVILPPGRGIRQEDIATSFVDMVLTWGLPRQLRLDNGSEYKWDAMVKGFYALAGLVGDFCNFVVSIMGHGETEDMIDGEQFQPRQAVSRARPYNAPAKQIESVFGIVEHSFFSLMRGWVGGDRLNKRTHKVGEAPLAHDGTDEEFLKDIGICLDLYRNTQQKDGSSPNDKRRAAIAAGWRPVAPSRETLLYALSEVRKLRVLPGGVQVDGLWYQGDVLVPLIGKRVEINVAKWDRAQVFYFDDVAKKRHAIPRATYYEQDDPAGAKEQTRLAGLQAHYLREMRSSKNRLDLVGEAARYNAELPPPPVLPEGITITTAEGTEIAEALKNTKAPAPVRLLPGERIHPSTGARLTIAPPKEERPGAVAATPGPAKVQPLPLPKKPSNPAPAEFDLLKRLQASHQSQPKE